MKKRNEKRDRERERARKRKARKIEGRRMKKSEDRNE